MMTVVTTMELQPDAQEDYDQLIEERFRSAHGRDGWIAGQLLSSSESPNVRVIVGTWRSEDDSRQARCAAGIGSPDGLV